MPLGDSAMPVPLLVIVGKVVTAPVAITALRNWA